MLILSDSLLQKPVISLRTGGKVATVDTAILNPNNLKIEGFYCTDHFSNQRLILLSQDIRDILMDGFVVDDHDVLSEPEDLIRLKSILEIGFELIGKPVQTEHKKRVGKIANFAADSQTLYVQKLYVGHSLLKNLTTSQLVVDRNQIVEITNRRIIIKEPLQPAKITAVAAPA